MADIFETTQKSKDRNWQHHKEVKSLKISSVSEENSSKPKGEDKNSDKSSVNEQTFHPTDKIF